MRVCKFVLHTRINNMDNKEIAKQLEKYLEDNEMTEQMLANATNTHQSYISRLKNGNFKRITEKVENVCEYASIDLISHKKVNPAENSDLMKALGEVWDGSDKKAKALAKVIVSLKGLS